MLGMGISVSECKCSLPPSQALYLAFSIPRKHPKFNFGRCPKKPAQLTCVLKVGFDDIAEIINNKVLIAAGVSAAIGQLSKPLTSVFLYGKDLDFRTAFQAGGFPSTHSSSVVAAATALALDRGFSDSIFGLSMVYAGLIMYDAQGVRREVGNHARVLNKLLSDTQVNSRCDEFSLGKMNALLSREEPSVLQKPSKTSEVQRPDNVNKVKQREQMVVSSELAPEEVEEGTDQRPAMYNSAPPLKESIGHTEVEVVAGALLGFFVSLAVYAVL